MTKFKAYLENDFLENCTVQPDLLCHHSATRADFKVVRNGQKPAKSLITMVPPHGVYFLTKAPINTCRKQ